MKETIAKISKNKSWFFQKINKIDKPKCPLTDEWVNKMWHIYTMEYYSAIKRNKIEFF